MRHHETVHVDQPVFLGKWQFGWEWVGVDAKPVEMLADRLYLQGEPGMRRK